MKAAHALVIAGVEVLAQRVGGLDLATFPSGRSCFVAGTCSSSVEEKP
jgi:hypothetical protein